MITKFSVKIAPHVQNKLEQANKARQSNNSQLEFTHLENAHVLGQASTYWHVKVHWQMLLWALRNKDIKEFSGQLFRIIGAASKTAIGLVPEGNTGGTKVSPFKRMPIQPEHQNAIDSART